MGWTEIILAILTAVGFLGALPQLWGSNWKEIWVYYWKGIVSWKMVRRSILRVKERLREENFQPTNIIGIGRGGIICAGLLCSEMINEELVDTAKIKKEELRTPPIRLGIMNTTLYLKPTAAIPKKMRRDSMESLIDKTELSDVEVNIRENDKILLIVAQTYSGITLESATNLLLSKGISRENIKTVTVFWHKHPNIEVVHSPDIFGSIISIKKTMPWKYYEVTTDRY
jgi:hypoxanthine phosphoribosyltransferase